MMDEPTNGWVNPDNVDQYRQTLASRLISDYSLRERFRVALTRSIPPDVRREKILNILREVGYAT